MKPKLVIYGASGHGKVAADTALATGAFEVVGFIDDDPSLHGRRVLDRPVLGDLSALPAALTQVFIAVGRNAVRLELAARLRQRGLTCPVLVHPRAVVGGAVSLGAGTLIAAGAVVQAGCVLGEQVIINTLAGVDHDCRIDDGAHVGPGAHLAGGVRVGRGAMIGIGAALREGVRIGAMSMIGAGAAVVRDVPDNVTAVGVPARVRDLATDEH